MIAIPSATASRKKELYDFYKQFGCKIKNYDYPTVQTVGAKPSLREFDIEDLLFRKQIQVVDENTKAYFKNKVVLITGGGGSIGSELCRQLAKMNPKQIVILDIYENGVYDVQQELKLIYKNELDLEVEIASITDRQAMRMVFENIILKLSLMLPPISMYRLWKIIVLKLLRIMFSEQRLFLNFAKNSVLNAL